jgi:hypothetical protein
MNMRRHYTLTSTTTFRTPLDPCWDKAARFRGTPRQVVDEIRSARRRAAGCDVAFRVTGPEGEKISVADLEREVHLADLGVR